MKIQFKILFLLIVPFFISGCYTVVWTPEMDFPDESDYDNSYNTYYLDEYHYYYDYPWWLSIAPPHKYRNDDKSYERNNETQNIRNSGNGRNSSADSGNEVLDTPSATRSKQDNNSSDNSSGNKSSSNENTKKTETSGSNNSTNTSRQSSDDSSNKVRNNDGNRNNGRSR